jgi:hypothetical protein
MRTVFTALGVFVAAVSAIAQTTRTQPNATNPQASAGSPHQSPFACNLLALSPAARTRHFDELEPQLRRLKTAVRELANGYAFRFPADSEIVRLLAEWAAGERLCCPFFDIDIRMEPEGGPLWLTLTGRAGTKDFIRADAPEWLNP